MSSRRRGPLPYDNTPDGHFHMQTGPQGIVVGLTEPVTFDPNAFMLSNLTTGGAITQLTHLNAGSTPSATHIWRVETIGDNNVAGALPRGNYEIAINKDLVTATLGQDYLSSFFFQPADFNHDRTVNIDDIARLDGNINNPPPQVGFSHGDTNYDGKLNIDDYPNIDAWMGTRLPAPPDEPYELAAGVADRLRIQDFGITPAMEAAGGTVRYVLGHPTEAWKAELDLFSNGAAEIEARVLATKQFPVAAHVMELQTAGGAVLGSLSISDGDVAAIFKAANTVLSQAGVELVPPTVAAGNLVNPRPTTDSTFFDTTWTATNSSMDDLITTYQTPLIDVFFVRSIDAGTTSGGAQFPGMTDVLLNDEPGIVVTAYTNTTGAGPRRSNNEIARTLAHEFLHYAMKTKDHDPERKWNLFHEGNTGFPWKRDIDGTQAQKIIDAGLSPNSPDQ